MSMTSVRALAIVIVATVAAGCAAGGPAPSSPRSSPPPGGPVVTEGDAVARVIAVEPRFTGITARDPDLIGQAAWYEVMPASGVGAFIVTMRIGWGDCPAGCIDEHTWTYAVGPDGSVRLQSERGAPVPAAAWPSPSDATAASDTGIRITAVSGPTCPVERFPPDPACAAKPVAGATILIGDASGQPTGMVVTDDAGQAFADLAAGTYTVSAQGSAGFMSGPEPQQVLVEDGSITELTLSYDTGIR
jgi:hypothetical protein